MHNDSAIYHAKELGNSEKKNEVLFEALSDKGMNLYRQARYQEALAIQQESYHLVAEAYTPTHSLVLKAAINLIDTLIQTKDYEDCERYERKLYETLTPPKNNKRESDEFANTCESLSKLKGKLIAKQQQQQEGGGEKDEQKYDLIEAEMLASRAVTIKERMYGRNSLYTYCSLFVLADILQLKESHYDEVKDLLDRSQAVSIKLHLIITN